LHRHSAGYSLRYIRKELAGTLEAGGLPRCDRVEVCCWAQGAWFRVRGLGVRVRGLGFALSLLSFALAFAPCVLFALLEEEEEEEEEQIRGDSSYGYE